MRMAVGGGWPTRNDGKISGWRSRDARLHSPDTVAVAPVVWLGDRVDSFKCKREKRGHRAVWPHFVKTALHTVQARRDVAGKQFSCLCIPMSPISHCAHAGYEMTDLTCFYR